MSPICYKQVSKQSSVFETREYILIILLWDCLETKSDGIAYTCPEYLVILNTVTLCWLWKCFKSTIMMITGSWWMSNIDFWVLKWCSSCNPRDHRTSLCAYNPHHTWEVFLVNLTPTKNRSVLWWSLLICNPKWKAKTTRLQVLERRENIASQPCRSLGWAFPGQNQHVLQSSGRRELSIHDGLPGNGAYPWEPGKMLWRERATLNRNRQLQWFFPINHSEARQ